LEYRPGEAAYWDAARLAEDMRQAFDICNGCRLCYNLCPAFPALFTFVEGHDDQAGLLTTSELDQVADLCFQCKICFLKCPYTPPHRFDLDFPRLMLRSKAVRARQQGLPAADRFLGDPDRTGRLATRLAPLANWATRQPMLRRVMERRVGIDRRRRLPRYARVRFSRWAARRTVADGDVVLFSTCTVEYNEPGLGQAAVAVLEHNGFRVAVPAGQQCCGMPALDGGDVDGAVRRARANLALLAPYAAQGKPILALQPTCAYVLKEEYPLLVGGEVAKSVAAATVDVTDFLAGLAKAVRSCITSRAIPGPRAGGRGGAICCRRFPAPVSPWWSSAPASTEPGASKRRISTKRGKWRGSWTGRSPSIQTTRCVPTASWPGCRSRTPPAARLGIRWSFWRAPTDFERVLAETRERYAQDSLRGFDG